MAALGVFEARSERAESRSLTVCIYVGGGLWGVTVGADTCDLPCHYAGTEPPSPLDDLSPAIDPEPPPD